MSRNQPWTDKGERVSFWNSRLTIKYFEAWLKSSPWSFSLWIAKPAKLIKNLPPIINIILVDLYQQHNYQLMI